MQHRKMAFTFDVHDDPSTLPPQYSKLLDRAKAALAHSYAPYSQYRVGAAVLLGNGEVLAGGNQENAAYPLCLCAERVVLSAAAAQFPEVHPQALAVVVAQGNEPATPCGACRQVIAEQEMRFSRDIALILRAANGPAYCFTSVKPLLPLAFTSEALNT